MALLCFSNSHAANLRVSQNSKQLGLLNLKSRTKIRTHQPHWKRHDFHFNFTFLLELFKFPVTYIYDSINVLGEI